MKSSYILPFEFEIHLQTSDFKYFLICFHIFLDLYFEKTSNLEEPSNNEHP